MVTLSSANTRAKFGELGMRGNAKNERLHTQPEKFIYNGRVIS